MNSSAAAPRAAVPALLAGSAVLLQGFTLGTIATLVVAAAVAVALNLRSSAQAAGREPASANALDLAVFALGAWLLGAASVAAVPADAALAVWQQLLFVLVYFGCLRATADDSGWHVFRSLLVALALLLSLWAIAGDLMVVRPGMRAAFRQQNSLSAYLLLLVFVLLPHITCERSTSAATARWLPAAAVFVSLFVVFHTLSRAALGAWVLAFAGFWLCSRDRARTNRLVLALALWAFLCADLSHQGGVFDSVRSVGILGQHALDDEYRLLLDDDSTAARLTAMKLASAHERFLIWGGVLELLPVTPWFGYGPGSFRWVYPAVAAAGDTTAGAYAHNDYAQLYVELGIPGLVLAVVLGAAVLARWWRGRARSASAGYEANALFWGLVALAAHSFFSYNFYVPATLALAAIVLARLRAVTPALVQLPGLRAAALRAPFRVAISLVIVLTPAATLGCGLMMSRAYAAGTAALTDGRLEPALAAFARADAWHANALNDVARATVYVSAARAATAPARRTELLAAADEHLARAGRRNPFAPEVPYARFLLDQIRYNGDRNGLDHHLPRHLAATLVRDPRFAAVRAEMARYLRDTDRVRGAILVLEEGLAYAFRFDRRALDYLALLHELYQLAHDDAGAMRAERAMRRMARLIEVWG